MATIPAPALSPYLLRNPIVIAQNKYALQSWNETYASIAMIAFAALDLIANFYLSPLMVPLSALTFNAILLTLGAKLVLPQVMEWLNEAKHLKAQGDKEMHIHREELDLRAMDPSELDDEFASYQLSMCDTPEISDSQIALLARINYLSSKCETLESTAHRLKDESKFQEAQETRLAYYKTAAKAVFLTYILSNPHTPGTFKDHFVWIEMPIQERAFRAGCQEPSAKYLFRTRTEASQFFTSDDMDNDIEDIREKFGFMLGAHRVRSEPPSAECSNDDDSTAVDEGA
ncbi:MAG TPA: hypothetical protein VIJ46_00050 [Rhabdochlamydiaceae bacterium]